MEASKSNAIKTPSDISKSFEKKFDNDSLTLQISYNEYCIVFYLLDKKKDIPIEYESSYKVSQIQEQANDIYLKNNLSFSFTFLTKIAKEGGVELSKKPDNENIYLLNFKSDQFLGKIVLKFELYKVIHKEEDKINNIQNSLKELAKTVNELKKEMLDYKDLLIEKGKYKIDEKYSFSIEKNSLKISAFIMNSEIYICIINKSKYIPEIYEIQFCLQDFIQKNQCLKYIETLESAFDFIKNIFTEKENIELSFDDKNERYLLSLMFLHNNERQKKYYR